MFHFRNMKCILPLFFLCLEILGNYPCIAVTPEHVDKPSSSKAKLAKDEFAAGLKKAKPGSDLSRLGELKASTTTTELNWESADLGITPPPGYENETIQIDSHTYYNSTFYADPNDGEKLWIDVDALPQEQVVTHAMLSSSHRQATTVVMSFDFPFYGSKLRNITIATGGFLYMGNYLHNWIAATQYIAPLMANFDTTLSEDSTIKYADNGTMFTVQWNRVHLQGRLHDGAFTFQVNLFKNGDISFAYKEMPFPISDISDDQHPVKIGLSDAYILERAIFFVRRKTIYEYHRVDMMKKTISNNTGIYFTALPTCLDFDTCDSCIQAPDNLDCMWCNSVQRCSDGVDRLRQSWVSAGCVLQHQTTCPAMNPVAPSSSPSQETMPSTEEHAVNVITAKSSTEETNKKPSSIVSTLPSNINKVTTNSEPSDFDVTAHPYIQKKEPVVGKRDSVSVSPGAIVTIVIFIAVIVAVGVWVFYAYRFPQSSSGQFLIKYRPTQWSFKPDGRDTTTNAFHM